MTVVKYEKFGPPADSTKTFYGITQLFLKICAVSKKLLFAMGMQPK